MRPRGSVVSGRDQAGHVTINTCLMCLYTKVSLLGIMHTEMLLLNKLVMIDNDHSTIVYSNTLYQDTIYATNIFLHARFMIKKFSKIEI